MNTKAGRAEEIIEIIERELDLLRREKKQAKTETHF